MSEPEFISSVSIERLLQLKDKTFSEQLLELIDESGMSDIEVYKKARIDLEKLLRSAGYSLSNSLETDIIIRYFIKKKKYNLDLLNEVLFYYEREIVAH